MTRPVSDGLSGGRADGRSTRAGVVSTTGDVAAVSPPVRPSARPPAVGGFGGQMSIGNNQTRSIRKTASTTRFRSIYTPALWNGIIAAHVKRMTLGNPLDPKPRAFQRAIALDRFVGVARARRFEPALREDEMRQRQLVPANESHYENARDSLQRHVSVSTAPVNSARRAANEAVYADRFARITRSIAGRVRSTSRRRISRSRRRRRLRATADD